MEKWIIWVVSIFFGLMLALIGYIYAKDVNVDEWFPLLLLFLGGFGISYLQLTDIN